ncbi:MAG: DUF5916 domain-containing protein [Burkholderiaceae bacterium]
MAVRLAAGEAMRLDGRLDEPAWSRAPAYRRFRESAPRNGAPASHDTEVRVLFDAHALWIGVRAADPEPGRIRDFIVRRDRVDRTQDFVLIVLDPIGTRRSAQFFRVNAGGSLADGVYTAADDSEDYAPDHDFDAATARDAAGWSAELRIPFASLRYGDRLGEGWRILVGRRVPREQFHLITSVPIPDDAASFIATLQPLQGVEVDRGHQFLSLRPGATLRRERFRVDGQAQPHAKAFDASLDVKWRPVPQLVVDATLNPDFSQIDLDAPQLHGNSSFALYLAEKRPFFFESSDLLRSPTDAIYTRSLTEPRWGARATWRASEVATTAFAIDDRGGGITLLPAPYGTGSALQPASRAVVARTLADAGAVQFGAIAVARRYEQDRGDNHVAGPDLHWSIDDQWRLRAQWLGSHTTALPDAAGGLSAGPAQRGSRLYATLVRKTDDTQFDATAEEVDAAFRHDSGFVNQTGVRRLELHQGFGWRHVAGLNELWLNLNGGAVDDLATGERVSSYATPGLYLSGARNSALTLEWRGATRVRSSAAAPLLHERYLFASGSITPSPWVPLVESSLSIGTLADVVADRSRRGGRSYVLVRTRPLQALEIEPRVSNAWLDDQGQRMYHESAAQLLAVWHFDPQRHLRLIVQRSALQREAEPAVAAQRAVSRVASLTYSWRRSAGTVLYVGASRAGSGPAPATRGTEVFVKLQFDVDDTRGFW